MPELNRRRSRKALKQSERVQPARRRNAEAITAMGMVGRIAKHWHELNRNFVATSGRASDVGGGLGAVSKVLRLLLQSAILAVGAWLVINQRRPASSSPARF